MAPPKPASRPGLVQARRAGGISRRGPRCHSLWGLFRIYGALVGPWVRSLSRSTAENEYIPSGYYPGCPPNRQFREFRENREIAGNRISPGNTGNSPGIREGNREFFKSKLRRPARGEGGLTNDFPCKKSWVI